MRPHVHPEIQKELPNRDGHFLTNEHALIYVHHVSGNHFLFLNYFSRRSTPSPETVYQGGGNNYLPPQKSLACLRWGVGHRAWTGFQVLQDLFSDLLGGVTRLGKTDDGSSTDFFSAWNAGI